jgi:hypothetical protein
MVLACNSKNDIVALRWRCATLTGAGANLQNSFLARAVFQKPGKSTSLHIKHPTSAQVS